ncbi:hypothetical protein EON67_04050, partial [archaeon]
MTVKVAFSEDVAEDLVSGESSFAAASAERRSQPRAEAEAEAEAEETEPEPARRDAQQSDVPTVPHVRMSSSPESDTQRLARGTPQADQSCIAKGDGKSANSEMAAPVTTLTAAGDHAAHLSEAGVDPEVYRVAVLIARTTHLRTVSAMMSLLNARKLRGVHIDVTSEQARRIIKQLTVDGFVRPRAGGRFETVADMMRRPSPTGGRSDAAPPRDSQHGASCAPLTSTSAARAGGIESSMRNPHPQ